MYKYNLTSVSHLFGGGFSVDLYRVAGSGPAGTSATVSPATSTRTRRSHFGAPRRATDWRSQSHRVPAVSVVATNRCSHNSTGGGDRVIRRGRRLSVGSAARSADVCSIRTPTSPTLPAAQPVLSPPATTPLPPLIPAVTQRGSQCSRSACRAPDATALAKRSSGGNTLLWLPVAELRQSLRWMATIVAEAPPTTTCSCGPVYSAYRASSRRSPSASRSLYSSCDTLG